MSTIDPKLDLTIERVIKAPPSRVWEAWTRPDQLAKWWVPAPTVARIDRLDVRPATPAPVAMTAEISFVEHADGTDYRAVVRHGTPADRDVHEEFGFHEGWGAVTAALAELAEAQAVARR